MWVVKSVSLSLLLLLFILSSSVSVKKTSQINKVILLKIHKNSHNQSIHVDNKIINGQDSSPYPHHVYISYQNAAGGGFFGAGSIITSNHVLTVAQIVRGFVSWNIGYGSNHFSLLSWIRTEEAIVHPNYNLDSRENDIAVLVVPVQFQWSEYVRPAILPPTTQQLPLANEQGAIVGFGWTGSDGVQANQLQAGFVRVLPDDQCQHIIAVSFPNHFCAHDAIVPANICQGDLGGGFLTHYRHKLILVGINSILLEGCNTAWPSAYTRIYPYLSWIATATGGLTA